MADRILHPEFRDRQNDSAYPFGDDAMFSASSGAEIYVDTFIDARIHTIGGEEEAAVTEIEIEARTATIYVGDSGDSQRASGTFDFISPGDTILLADRYGRPAGMFLSDATRLSIFQSWSKGSHKFVNAQLAASVVVPIPGIGVRGFLTEAGDLFTGDIWIVGENGAVVRQEENTIRVDFVGDPLFARRLCEEAGLFVTPNFLRTINGQPPDSRGDFQLVVGDHGASDTILRIIPISGGLRIKAVGQLIETARAITD